MVTQAITSTRIFEPEDSRFGIRVGTLPGDFHYLKEMIFNALPAVTSARIEAAIGLLAPRLWRLGASEGKLGTSPGTSPGSLEKCLQFTMVYQSLRHIK